MKRFLILLLCATAFSGFSQIVVNPNPGNTTNTVGTIGANQGQFNTNGGTISIKSGASITNISQYGNSLMLPIPTNTATNLVIVSSYGDIPSNGAGNYGPSTGQTNFEFIVSGQQYRVRQKGTIKQVKLVIASVVNIVDFRVKTWRESTAGNFDLIGTSENLTSQLSAGSVNTLSLAGVFADEGDYLGVQVVYSSASAQVFRARTPGSPVNSLFSISDSESSYTNFAWRAQTEQTTSTVPIEAYMTAPLFVGIGDSLMSGGSVMAGLANASSAGTFLPRTGIPFQISRRLGGVPFQNLGVNGNKMYQINERLTNDVLNLKPKYVILEGGCNDLSGGSNATQVISYYQTILPILFNNNIKPIVHAIYPFRNHVDSTDQTMIYRDTVNQWLSNNVAAYNGVYVDSDTWIGTYWPGGSTNNYWALSTDADFNDGKHLTVYAHEQIADATMVALGGTVVVGNLTAGTLSMNGDIMWSGDVEMNLKGGRATVAQGAAKPGTIEAPGAAAQSTNSPGGTLYLKGGKSTGTGPSRVKVQTTDPAASPYVDGTYADVATFESIGATIHDRMGIGANSDIDARFLLRVAGPLSSNTLQYGIQSSPRHAGGASNPTAAIKAAPVFTGEQRRGAGLMSDFPTISGGRITNYAGLQIIPSTANSDTYIGMYIGTDGGWPILSSYAVFANTTLPTVFLGNVFAVGENATVDERYGFFQGGAVGNGTIAYGGRFSPTISSNQFTAGGINVGLTVTNGSVQIGTGITIAAPSYSGNGGITNMIGMKIENLTTGTNNIGIYYGADNTVPSGNWFIYSAVATNETRLLGTFSVRTNMSIGLSGSPDSRYPLVIQGIAGNGTSGSGIYSNPQFQQAHSGIVSGINSQPIFNNSSTHNQAAGIVVSGPTVTGGASVTNFVGLQIENSTAVNKWTGLMIGSQGGFPSGTSAANWAILTTVTNASRIVGNSMFIGGNASSTLDARYGLGYFGNMAGNATTAIGLYNNPTMTAYQSSLDAAFVSQPAFTTVVHGRGYNGLFAAPSGSVTNYTALAIESATAPTNTTMLFIGQLSAQPTMTNYAIFVQNTASNYFGGHTEVAGNAYVGGIPYDKQTWGAVAVITSSFTVQPTNATCFVDCTSGAVTITLPAASDSYSTLYGGHGRVLEFKKTDASANAMTIQRNGSDTLDGGTQVSTTTQGAGFTIAAGGTTAWFVKP